MGDGCPLIETKCQQNGDCKTVYNFDERRW